MSFKLRNLVAATLAGSLLMSLGVNAMADSTDDIVNALISKGVLTEEEGALLMRGRTGEKEAAEAKKKTAVSAKFKDGLSFESGDGSFKAAINGRVHADYRFFDYNDSDSNTAPTAGNSIGNVTNVTDTFDVRRARLGFKVKYNEFYEGEVVADLTGGGASLDVGYLNVAWWKPVQFRFGQFKMPMGLEQLTSSNNIDFIERSFVDALVPAKEIGVMVHGTPFTGVTYALAASNGNAKNPETDIREDGKDIVGRVTANFAEIMGNKDMVLHAGVAYSQGDLPSGNAVGVAGRTEARGATFFRAPVLGNASFQSIDRSRLGLEGIVAYNQFKFQTEWMQQNNDFKTNSRGYDLDTTNWYAEALWAITGEKYADSYKGGAFGGIKPLKDFNPTDFSGGAWELGFRFSKFDASDYDTLGTAISTGGATTDTAFGVNNATTKAAGFSEAKSYVAGIKFLPNANMRFMINYVKTDFDNAIGGATGGVIVNNKRVDDEKALIMRAQWMF